MIWHTYKPSCSSCQLAYKHVISSFNSILGSSKCFIGVTQIEMHGSLILLA